MNRQTCDWQAMRAIKIKSHNTHNKDSQCKPQKRQQIYVVRTVPSYVYEESKETSPYVGESTKCENILLHRHQAIFPKPSNKTPNHTKRRGVLEKLSLLFSTNHNASTRNPLSKTWPCKTHPRTRSFFLPFYPSMSLHTQGCVGSFSVGFLGVVHTHTHNIMGFIVWQVNTTFSTFWLGEIKRTNAWTHIYIKLDFSLNRKHPLSLGPSHLSMHGH